ncbi:MAG: aspartyl-tRNA(Asn)/glutamyl-tRNA(Gln) amidotransferase subunit A [Polaribacter sp.]
MQAGLTSNGLPAGLHLMTPYLAEAKLLNIAHKFQQETDWHLKTPPSLANVSSASNGGA